MKFLANILTDKLFQDDTIYNVVSKKEDLIEDIPTLVIGWGLTKKLYENANILDWKINENTFWTFGKREKNQRYETTVKNFKEVALNKLIKSVNYTYVNILTKVNGIESLMYFLEQGNCMNIFINNDMLYINPCKTKIVYGYSIRDIEYCGESKKKLFAILYKNKNLNLIDNKDINSLDLKVGLKNYSYVIPCVF